MADNRDIKRHKKRYSVKFGINSPTRLAFTEDISTDGLFIRTANIPHIGTRILVELTTPNNETVSFEGIVRWCKKVPPKLLQMANKAGMGIRITRFITGETIYKQLIAEYLARYSDPAPSS